MTVLAVFGVVGGVRVALKNHYAEERLKFRRKSDETG